MEAQHYFEILRRRKWVIIITAATAIIVVTVATFLMTPIYSASATVRIAQIQDLSVSYFDLNYSDRLINTYVELVRSRPFLEQANQRLKLNVDPAILAHSVTAESVANTELLIITSEDSNPITAMLISNTLADLLVEEGENLYSGRGKSAREIFLDQLIALESNLKTNRDRLQALLSAEGKEELSGEIQDLNSMIFVQEQTYSTALDAYDEASLLDEARANTVSIAEPAVIPTVPSEPRVALNLLLGSMVGIAGGIGLAFLMESLDKSIYSPEDLEDAAHVPLLGAIPNLKAPAKLQGAPLLLQPNGRSSAVEAFNLLRSNVLVLDFGRPPQTLLITSVEPDAGKSTVLANLAAALGRSGRNIVAVDCDLRKPSLGKVFNVSSELGLTNAIVHEEDLESAVLETRLPGVKVVTSGPLAHNPAELLGLPRMRQLIGDLANWADLVLLDSPPLLHFSDAIMLAPYVDCVALVVSRGSLTGDQVQKALAQLVQVGVEHVGTVFNRAEAG